MRSIAFFMAAGLIASTASAAPPLPASSSTAVAAPTSALPPAAEGFVVGTLHVQRHGDHGRPLILIPGLASGAWVWDATVAHLRRDHVIYTVTLAGFDGTPPPAQKTGLMDQADAALLKLINSRHIDHPVLIGHSLGGTLAIRFATEHSNLLAGVIAVDGLPVFPGMQDLTAAQRAARAQAMKAQMAQTTPAQFQARQLWYMTRIGVLDPDMAARYAKLSARSDPSATAQYMAEDLAADHRPGLKNVSVPLLEISPYNAPDSKRAAAMGRPMISEADKTAYYRQLLSGTPHLKVLSISPSRHFVMLDQPAKFFVAVDRFLATLPTVQ